MDGQRFDLLSRWLVTGNSRRTTLRALAAGAVTAGLGRLGLDEAAAKCTPIGKKCQSKNGKHAKCCGGAKCKGKRCKCPGGAPACGKHKTCCQPGQVCQGDICVTGPGTCPTECCDDSDCAPDGQCALGICLFPPDCGGAQSHCSVKADCCSNSCVLPDTEICAKSTNGEPCHVDSDCDSQNCVFFVCN